MPESCNSLIHIRIKELTRVVLACLSRENHFYRPFWLNLLLGSALTHSRAHSHKHTHTGEESSQEICHFLAVF